MEIDYLQLISGINIPVPEVGFTLRQPTIKDIAVLGEQKYFLALQLFDFDLPKTNATKWQIFTTLLNQKIVGVSNIRELLTNFLNLFFIDRLNIGPSSLLLVRDTGVLSIEPEHFELVQNAICKVGGKMLLGSNEPQYKPTNKKAAEIAEKLKRGAAKRAKASGGDGENGFLERYIRAIVCGTSNSLEDTLNMTLFQANAVLQTMIAKEEYDLRIRAKLAGAKDDEKLIHWTAKNIFKTPEPNIGVI